MKNRKQFELSDLLSGEAEFIPLLSAEDEDFIKNTPIPDELAILPLRNTVLFPGVVIPITVGRDKSIKLVKENYKSNKLIGVVAQKDMNIEDPMFEDMFTIGTLARIIKSLQMPDGTTTIIIQGVRKFQIVSPLQTDPYHIAKVKAFDFEKDIHHYIDRAEFKAIIDTMKDISLQIVKNSPNLPSEAGFAIRNIESPNYLIHFISSNLNVGTIEKQLLLELNDVYEFANQVLKYLSGELELSKLKSKIQDKVKHDLDKQQRDYFLSQQLKTIQEELGGNPIEETLKSFKERSAKKKWDDETSQIFDKELQKLSRLNMQSTDY
jgi:ATP-dependent Lon protease